MAIGSTKTVRDRLLQMLAMPGNLEGQHPKQRVNEGAVF